MADLAREIEGECGSSVRVFAALALNALSHIRLRSSALKLSATLMRFSPFSLLKSFVPELDAGEERADGFGEEVQGTRRHLSSARRKMEEFEEYLFIPGQKKEKGHTGKKLKTQKSWPVS